MLSLNVTAKTYWGDLKRCATKPVWRWNQFPGLVGWVSAVRPVGAALALHFPSQSGSWVYVTVYSSILWKLEPNCLWLTSQKPYCYFEAILAYKCTGLSCTGPYMLIPTCIKHLCSWVSPMYLMVSLGFSEYICAGRKAPHWCFLTDVKASKK